MVDAPSKRCCTCKVEQDLSSFNKSAREKDGLQPRCRTCTRISNANWRDGHPGETSQQARAWALANKKRMADIRRKHKFGITPEQYDGLVTSQNGQCAICGRVPDVLVVDHCHASGRIRGLLCHHCNVGIGFLRDDPGVANAAADYLSR